MFLTGLLVALIGLLWLLQGLGVVQMQPILCFANCTSVQGPSNTWAVIGATAIVLGGAALRWSLKPHAQ
jgi:hypothetical protein